MTRTETYTLEPVRRTATGAIDLDHYLAAGRQARSEGIAELYRTLRGKRRADRTATPAKGGLAHA